MRNILFAIFAITGIFIFNGIMESKTEERETGNMELVFILDRSGSMSGLEKDTIGGYNSMLEKQKKTEKDKVYVTTVLFDDKYELLHDGVLLDKMKPITEKE